MVWVEVIAIEVEESNQEAAWGVVFALNLDEVDVSQYHEDEAIRS